MYGQSAMLTATKQILVSSRTHIIIDAASSVLFYLSVRTVQPTF